ncbi:type IV pilin protein [Synechococcus sp. MIT S1220]|uniref:type IV pilin protein n=1 Tax=Synechococcus sp. MIT S1220 TaxID=3082549 RepID=UPI0039AF4CB8
MTSNALVLIKLKRLTRMKPKQLIFNNSEFKNGFSLIELVVTTVIVGILSAVAIPRLASHVEKARLTEAQSIRAAIWKQVDVLILEGQDAFQVEKFLKEETKRATLASRDFNYSAFGLRHISGTMLRVYIQVRSRTTPVKIEAECMNTNLSNPNRLWTRKTLEYQLEATAPVLVC